MTNEKVMQADTQTNTLEVEQACAGAQRLAVNKPQARGSTLKAQARLGLEKVELVLQLHYTTASRAFVFGIKK